LAIQYSLDFNSTHQDLIMKNSLIEASMNSVLFMPDIDPIIFQIGFVSVRWYALAYIAGIVLGWIFIHHLITNTKLWTRTPPPLKPAQLDDLIFWLILGIIIGGRLGYVLAYNTSMIWEDPLGIVMINQGGMSFHGGLLGVAIVAYFTKRNLKLSHNDFLSLGDLLAVAAPMGLFFGRLANFINGELWGRVTTHPWGMVFCNQFTITTDGSCPAGLLPRHPSQLYEAALEGLLLFIIGLVALYRFKALEKPGLLSGLFLSGYAIARMCLEQVREPDAQMMSFLKGSVTMGLLLSIPMLIAGLWLIYRAMKPVPTTLTTQP
jgi:phosphatidylglycerol:prolipoprotein diacylglycerol transferase